MTQRQSPRALRRHGIAALALLLACTHVAHALEHITLRNGFELDCVRRVIDGDKVRLYLPPSSGQTTESYLELPASSVLRVETLPDPPPVPHIVPAGAAPLAARAASTAEPTALELQQMLSRAGAAHHIDSELLASVIHAESGGHAHAVSRVGARGLMQLMPGTAAALGVHDAFVAEQNVEGGTSYLDALLTRYKDNISLALAAYNAGPGAVDKYHGIPPYRETRAYVARIIREFNRRKVDQLARTALLTAQATPPAAAK